MLILREICSCSVSSVSRRGFPALTPGRAPVDLCEMSLYMPWFRAWRSRICFSTRDTPLGRGDPAAWISGVGFAPNGYRWSEWVVVDCPALKMRPSGFSPTLNGDARFTDTFLAYNALATLLSTALRVVLTVAGGLVAAPSLAVDLLPDIKVEGLLPETPDNFLALFIPFIPLVKLCLLAFVCCGTALTEDFENEGFSAFDGVLVVFISVKLLYELPLSLWTIDTLLCRLLDILLFDWLLPKFRDESTVALSFAWKKLSSLETVGSTVIVTLPMLVWSSIPIAESNGGFSTACCSLFALLFLTFPLTPMALEVFREATPPFSDYNVDSVSLFMLFVWIWIFDIYI